MSEKEAAVGNLKIHFKIFFGVSSLRLKDVWCKVRAPSCLKLAIFTAANFHLIFTQAKFSVCNFFLKRSKFFFLTSAKFFLTRSFDKFGEIF